LELLGKLCNSPQERQHARGFANGRALDREWAISTAIDREELI
jgi:hypothetical protein